MSRQSKANQSFNQTGMGMKWSSQKSIRLWLASIRRASRKTTRSIHHNWRFPPVPIGGLVGIHITISVREARMSVSLCTSWWTRNNTLGSYLPWSSVSANLNTTRPSTIPWFRCLSTADMCGGAPEHLGHVSILRPDFIKLLFRPSFKYVISRFHHPITPSTVVSVREGSNECKFLYIIWTMKTTNENL